MKILAEFYRHTNQFINDAIDRIIVEIHLKNQREGFKTIMLSGCEPGVGTTTLSISLAISLANAGWRTILIDGDLRKVSKYKRLNENITIGLSEFLSGTDLYQKAVYDTNHKNLYYMPSGGRVNNPISLLCSGRAEELIAQLGNDYDYIIMDMPSITTSVDPTVLVNKMDGVILVAEYARTDIRSVRESKEILQRAGGNLLGIILNKVKGSEYGHMLKNFDYYKKQKYVTRRLR